MPESDPDPVIAGGGFAGATAARESTICGRITPGEMAHLQ
jgi:hypothetical protein